MKKLLVLLVILILGVIPAAGQITKEVRKDGTIHYSNKPEKPERPDKPDKHEPEVREMVQATIPANLQMYSDANDPSEPGEIKVVTGTVQDIHHCDAIDDGTATWSVHSGAGVQIQLWKSVVFEGSGSILVSVPAGVTGVVKATKNAGSWDLSLKKFLKFHLWRSSFLTWGNLYFGEAAYNEQSHAIADVGTYVWKQNSWDISGIAASSRDGVTIVAVSGQSSPSFATYFLIDYVYADPGPAKVKFCDNNGVVKQIYPVAGGSFSPSDSLFASADTEQSHTGNTTYTKKKEIAIQTPGTVRIKFDLKISIAGGAAYGKVFKNDVALGTEQTASGDTVYHTLSEDLGAFVEGDLIQVKIHPGNAGHTAYIKNFRLYGDKGLLGTSDDYIVNID